MTRPRLAILTLVAGILASVAVAVPAVAADAASVQVVGQQGREVDFIVYLDPDVDASPGNAVGSTVVVSGTEVPSEASLVVESNAPREAILVLDVSGSMRGERIAAARDAAAAYVKALPPDVSVGLVTFNDKVTVDIAPTTDRDAVLAAIDDVRAGRRTALYDGISQGLDLADPDLGARLVVLSDGGDTTSVTTQEEVLSRIASEDVPVDVVALTPSVEHAAVLREMASSSDGQFLLATDANGLLKAFEEASGSFGGKVAVRAQMPEGLNASAQFAIVTVDVGGTGYVGTAKLPRDTALEGTDGAAPTAGPTAPTSAPVVPVPQATGSGTNLSWFYAILAGLVIIVVALTIAYSGRVAKAVKRTDQVLWYSNEASTPRPGQRRAGVAGQQSYVPSLDRMLARRKGYPAAEAKLDNAELQFTPGNWLIIRLAITVVVVLLFAILMGNLLFAMIVGGLIGWVGTSWYIGSRETKRRKAFETELPDFLLLIASSLRSGLSFSQALESTAAEGQGQVSRQMRRALSEHQMGMPIEEALMRAANRMESDDLRWTVTALKIQREVGGNLSNILETAANTVKSRAELRREVRTLSAEGRLSGYVLAALPVGVFFYLALVNRPYVQYFWTESTGRIMLVVLMVVFVLGFIWMRRLVRIKV